MDLIPRKRCSKCSTVYEGREVERMYSCEMCGNGYLTTLEPVDLDRPQAAPLPRGGGETVTHTRESF